MVLMKYGFDDIVDRLDIPGIRLVKKIHKVDQEMGTFERIRCTLAAGVIYTYGIVLSPAMGAVLMSLSTVIVAINARFLKITK